MRIAFLPLLVLATLCVADSATQTDWSGGPGISGYPTSWGDRFSDSDGILWNSLPGSILLEAYPAEHLIGGYEFCCWCVHCADIDMDGDMDVIDACTGRPWADVCWWENTSDTSPGVYWTPHVVTNYVVNARSVHSEDVDSDGDTDIITTDSSLGEVLWWENSDGSGTSWTERGVDYSFGSAWWACSDDVDADGDKDIIGAGRSTGVIAWWENLDGQGVSWAAHQVDNQFEYAECVRTGDIDGDDDVDIVGAKYSDHPAVAWWENTDGAGTTWEKHWVLPWFTGHSHSVWVADMDGDGDMDIVGCPLSISTVAWWENADGTGTSWVQHLIDQYFGCPTDVAAFDLDGDEDLDVLATNFSMLQTATWWENADGVGSDWIEHQISFSEDYEECVHGGDLDGDGVADPVAAGLSIAWWDLDGASVPDGSLESSWLYLQNDPGWGAFSWVAQEPSGTSVAFQVRATDSPGYQPPWSDTLHTPSSLQGILDDYDSYFQYKAILQTSDSSLTPVLEEVTLTWDPLGLEEPSAYETRLLGAIPNPSSGPATVGLSLKESACAELSVFDLSGRLLEKSTSEFPQGQSEITISDLQPGVYFVRMTSGDFTATQRFVVVD